jgi:hypothetical protein
MDKMNIFEIYKSKLLVKEICDNLEAKDIALLMLTNK